MTRSIKLAVALTVLLAGLSGSVMGFSLLGPFADWQTAALNYNSGVGMVDVGGPQNLGEEYRWNIPTLYVGLDPSFVAYFGAKGTQAVWEAIQILNNLPKVSNMSSNLSEFPLNTRYINYRASALGLIDLRSAVLGAFMEFLGLASPERYVFTLRARTATAISTNYVVIMRNFDPVTWEPSKYVNGVLYTYVIHELPNPPWPAGAADAIEIPVDPYADAYTSVASILDGYWAGSLALGEFVTGLTRDDAGGLRYLYSKYNVNIETAPTNATYTPAGPWSPVYPTNMVVSNLTVSVALRPGVEKIEFRLAQYERTYGYFIPITNTYTDYYYTNYGTTSYLVSQTISRVLVQPDIVIAAGDLGLSADGIPVWMTRGMFFQSNTNLYSTTPPFVNGPGQIVPPAQIILNKLGPYYINTWPYRDESYVDVGPLWGYFDGSTNPPVVFPSGISIQELERLALKK